MLNRLRTSENLAITAAAWFALGMGGGAVRSVAAWQQPPAAQQEEAAQPKAEPQGPLEEVAKEFSEAVSLEFSGGELRTKFPDQAGGQALFSALMRVSGGGGGSSSGGNMWRHSFRGNKLSGVFGSGSSFPMPARDRAIGNYLHLAEKQAPHRQVHLESNEDELQLMVIEPASGTVMRLRQVESGAVLLQMATPEFSESFQAESFNDLWFERAEILSEKFFPLLKKLGIGTPAVDLTEKLQAQVLNDLAYGAARQAEFLEAFKDLEAEDYETRAKATERLENEFANWSLPIARGLRDTTLNAEIRARLKKVFETKASADEKATAELMTSQKLDNNPQFLVRLLADCRTPEEKELVLGQLRIVAGKDLGAELDAWKSWADAAQPPRAESNIPEFAGNRALKEDALYFRGRVELSRLVKLTADGTSLGLDRESWKQRFGGKSVAQLAEDVQKQYDATNLPKSWLTLGDGYDLASTDYPHVLFEDVVSKLVEGSPYAQSHYINRRNQAMSRPKSLNRAFDIQHAFGELEMHSENQPQPNQEVKPEYLKLNLRDMNSEGSLLNLEEYPNGEFSLCFIDQAMDLVFLLTRQANQPTRLALLRGSEATYLSDASPVELFEKNKDVLRAKIFPVLQHAGIDLSEKLGGPLEFSPPKPSEK